MDDHPGCRVRQLKVAADPYGGGKVHASQLEGESSAPTAAPPLTVDQTSHGSVYRGCVSHARHHIDCSGGTGAADDVGRGEALAHMTGGLGCDRRPGGRETRSAAGVPAGGGGFRGGSTALTYSDRAAHSPAAQLLTD